MKHSPLTFLRSNESRIRAGAGLILFAFAATHLINHSLGLVSIDWMQRGQDFRLFFTRSIPGTIILCSAALIHFALGIWKFLRRRSVRIGWRDFVQLAFGLLIPVLLLRHVLGTRGVEEFFGIEDDYLYALTVMWPGEALNQAMLITLVWVHGCIGIHHLYSTKSWYRDTLWLWYGLALLIPTLGYAGFVTAGRTLALSGQRAAGLSPEQYQVISYDFMLADYGYKLILTAAILLWIALILAERFRHKVTVSYVNGPTVTAPQGATLLEISRNNRVPHAAVCGGRARCSTCRVRVVEGLERQPSPHDTETKVLKRVGAPPNVRLACQLRPEADLRVATLLPAEGNLAHGHGTDKYQWGVEQEVTLLFSDLRGFTRLSEGRLSFDIVFLLNQFLTQMGEAIEDSGGYIDKFMGDGIMAIFGMDKPREEGARNALMAARAMGGVLDALNMSLREELPHLLQVGIGIHTGTAILGRIGSADHVEAAQRITALGETVNIASRLESATKDLGVQVIISKTALEAAGIATDDKLQSRTIEIRGISQPFDIYTARLATDIPAL